MNTLKETARHYRKGYRAGIFSHNEMTTAIKKAERLQKQPVKTTRGIDELNRFFL